MVELAAQVMPYVTAAAGVYGAAVLSKVEDEAADATVSLGRRVLQREAARGSGDALTDMCLSRLAAVYRALGRHAEALPLQQRVLETRKDGYLRGPPTGLRYPDPWIHAHLGDLAATYEGLGRYAEALPLRQEAVEIIRARGDGYPDIANALDNLAATCAALGNHSWAVQLREQALEITEHARGPRHEDTTTRLSNLASARAMNLKEIEARLYQQSSPAPDDSR